MVKTHKSILNWISYCNQKMVQQCFIMRQFEVKSQKSINIALSWLGRLQNNKVLSFAFWLRKEHRTGGSYNISSCYFYIFSVSPFIVSCAGVRPPHRYRPRCITRGRLTTKTWGTSSWTGAVTQGMLSLRKFHLWTRNPSLVRWKLT